jgi:prephenate dehydrogenase
MHVSTAKVSTSQFVAQILPPDRHYIALTPTLNPLYLEESATGIDAAHADLFQNSQIVITTPPGTNAEAIRLASDLVAMLGATPLYGDPYELDGLLAATHILPQLSAAALLNATIHQPGWREARKVAGQVYAQATRPLLSSDDPQALGQAALQNADNVVRVLDDLIQELIEMRAALASADEDRLQQLLDQAVRDRKDWLEQRTQANWEQAGLPRDSSLKGSQIFSRLIGLGKKSGSDKGRK